MNGMNEEQVKQNAQKFRDEQFRLRAHMNAQLEAIRSNINNYALAPTDQASSQAAENQHSDTDDDQTSADENATPADNFALEGKRILLLGLDNAGKQILRHLRAREFAVVAFDELVPEADVRARADLQLADFDLIIATSVFGPQDLIIQDAFSNNIPVWSELELAWYLRANNALTSQPTPWIGITGTSGKSTTIEICRLIFDEAHFNVKVATEGNLLDAVLDEHLDFILIEVSSFLLQFAHSFSFEVSVILNIDEDHINWHGSLDEYRRSKVKIFNNTVKSCVFNADDSNAHRVVQEADVLEGARAIGFTHHSPGRSQVGQVAGLITDRAFYGDNTDPLRYLYANEIVNLSQFPQLLNPVGQLPSFLVDDIAAAVAVVRTYGVNAAEIASAIAKFTHARSSNQLVYKRELAGEVEYGVGNIYYVDNSNSNNPHSVESVIKTYPQKSVVWISGGDTKGIDYNLFITRIAPYISAAIVIGDENDTIWNALRKFAVELPAYRVEPYPFSNALTRGLQKADELVFANQTILISPASRWNYTTQEDLVLQMSEYIRNLDEKIREVSARRGRPSW
jgi:UDP-N-acetylmuramoylalanine--D-glutamate ligase